MVAGGRVEVAAVADASDSAPFVPLAEAELNTFADMLSALLQGPGAQEAVDSLHDLLDEDKGEN